MFLVQGVKLGVWREKVKNYGLRVEDLSLGCGVYNTGLMGFQGKASGFRFKIDCLELSAQHFKSKQSSKSSVSTHQKNTPHPPIGSTNSTKILHPDYTFVFQFYHPNDTKT